MSGVPSYVSIPISAIPIRHDHVDSSTEARAGPSRLSTARPTFPPSAQPTGPSSSGKKFTVSVPSGSSLTTNVSDMLLSSLLPPNLPKLPQTAGKSGPGRPRELSTQREALSVPLISNNFRRFVTRVSCEAGSQDGADIRAGPVFWLQDRIEEVLYWRKPTWTWAWLLLWTLISFKPRVLLLLPSFTLILILLHVHEKSTTIPSLLGVPLAPSTAGTVRVVPDAKNGSNAAAGGYSVSTAAEGDPGAPVVPPKEAESGVDYLMNVQAIQNLMGLVSDLYDHITPALASLSTPSTSTSPTAFPVNHTLILILLLPPTLLLPLTPANLIPFLLLPLGWVPPLAFHPNLTPLILSLPRRREVLSWRAKAEDLALTDSLDDKLGRSEISRVEVWENERLDPAVSAKSTSLASLPAGSWGSKFLRAGERAPWVKLFPGLWKTSEAWGKREGSGDREAKETSVEESVLGLQDGWAWVPGEDWRVDMSGEWTEGGTDGEGWSYTDDSWQNAASVPVTEADSTSATGGGMPVALRRVTRRRKWYRRVYMQSEAGS